MPQGSISRCIRIGRIPGSHVQAIGKAAQWAVSRQEFQADLYPIDAEAEEREEGRPERKSLISSAVLDTCPECPRSTSGGIAEAVTQNRLFMAPIATERWLLHRCVKRRR
jgi:hypothetical protein